MSNFPKPLQEAPLCDEAYAKSCADQVPYCYRIISEYNQSTESKNKPLIAPEQLLLRLGEFGCNLKCDSCVIEGVMTNRVQYPTIRELGDTAPGIIKSLKLMIQHS